MLIPAAPSIPRVVTLESSIADAQMIVSDARCSEEVKREGLQMYIAQSQKVDEYAKVAR
jgi:hypothetical protein